MYSNWKTCRLGDFITLRRGFDLPIQDRRSGCVPVVSSSGRTGTHDSAMVKGPGVVTGRYGTIGQVFYIDGDFWPLNTTLYVSDFKGNNPGFVANLLRTLDFMAYSDKSSVPGVNRNHLHTAEIRVPTDISEQKTIYECLNIFTSKIGLNRRMNDTLEAIARAIFKSWFVDFDPVRARTDAQQMAPFSECIVNLFPSEFAKSPIGKIPIGWQLVTFSAIVELLSGGTPKTSISEYWDGDIPWVSVADTVPGPYIVSTEKRITKAGVENSASKVLPEQTIVITARGTVGNTALLSAPMAMNQSCYGIRGKGQINQLFLFLLLRQQLAILKANTHGSVFETITRSTFDAIEVVKPPDKLLELFESTIRPLFDCILLNQREAITLAELRDTLLPKLLSGEIRIKQAEKLIETHT